MKSCVVVTFVALCILLFVGTTEAIMRPPEFELNLDLPPRQRWNGAVKKVIDAHGSIENSFGGVYDIYGKPFALISKLLPGIPEFLEKKLETQYPEHYQEIQGIADQFAALNYSMYNTTLLSSLVFFYEIAHTRELAAEMPADFYKACTGILSLPSDKTKPTIHGRNMDEEPPQGRNCTLSINVTKNNGELQFQMFDWMWVTTGVYTASRIGGVTLEMNWRNYGKESIFEIFDRLKQNETVPSLFAFRNIQSSNMEYEDAKMYLTKTQFAAPFYVIMSGTQRRGAVLTLYFNNTNNRVIELTDQSPVPYLVQTNYDHWLPDPPRDPRRTVAQNTLEDLGTYRAGTHLGVWMTLSTYPVHNPGTMFSVLMGVDRPLDGYIRRRMVPYNVPYHLNASEEKALDEEKK